MVGKKRFKKKPGLLWGILAVMAVGLMVFFFARDIRAYDYTVETNAFFAPFEFYENREIVGVDVEIINKVADKLNATIDIKNVELFIILNLLINHRKRGCFLKNIRIV